MPKRIIRPADQLRRMISEVPSLATRRLASRIETFSKLNAALVILSLASVFLLPSQSASSFITYFLALSVLVSARILWSDARDAAALIGFIVVLLVYLPLTSFWSEPFSWRGLFSVSIRSFLILAFILTFAVSLSRIVWFERYLARAICFSGTLAALVAIIEFFVHPPLDGRLNGLGELDTQVIAALVFGVALIFAIFLVTGERGFWRIAGVVSAAILISAIVLSGSRNAWMSVGIGVCCYLLSRRISRPGVFFGVLALLILGVVLVIFLLLSVYPATAEFLLPRGDSFRLTIWSTILQRVVQEGIWFGAGILSSNHIVANGIEFLHPHSMYLAILYHGGVLGLVLFMALLVNVMWTFFSKFEQEVSKLGLSILIIGLLAYTLDGWKLIDKVGSGWFLIWVPVAIAIKLQMDRLFTEAADL